MNLSFLIFNKQKQYLHVNVCKSIPLKADRYGYWTVSIVIHRFIIYIQIYKIWIMHSCQHSFLIFTQVTMQNDVQNLYSEHYNELVSGSLFVEYI